MLIDQHFNILIEMLIDHYFDFLIETLINRHLDFSIEMFFKMVLLQQSFSCKVIL